jgi:hypothetical protein
MRWKNLINPETMPNTLRKSFEMVSLLHMNSPLELLKKQLEAKLKWYNYQRENKKYNVEEVSQSRLEIKEIEIAINILIEKRREFRIGNQSIFKYLSD